MQRAKKHSGVWPVGSMATGASGGFHGPSVTAEEQITRLELKSGHLLLGFAIDEGLNGKGVDEVLQGEVELVGFGEGFSEVSFEFFSLWMFLEVTLIKEPLEFSFDDFDDVFVFVLFF